MDTHSLCNRCGRKLTDEMSRTHGMGPVCRRKHLEGLKRIREALQWMDDQEHLSQEGRIMESHG